MSPQVLAYSLGLGILVKDEKKLVLHMKAELDHNDSPYGLLVMTGMNQMCTLLVVTIYKTCVLLTCVFRSLPLSWS